MVDLESQIAVMRKKPLLVLARTVKGYDRIMTVQECADTGSTYLHIVANELDELLAAALSGE